MNPTIFCTRCQQTVEISKYSNNKNATICRHCRIKIDKEKRYLIPKEEKKALDREHYQKYKNKPYSNLYKKDEEYKLKKAAYVREYRKRFPERAKATAKKSRHKHKEKRNERVRLLRKEHPEKFLLQGIRHSFKNSTFLSGKKVGYYLNLVGVNSTAEFFCILSGKTDNPNWLLEKYQVDHIWQINWFRTFLLENGENESEIILLSKLIHHHSNLRPMSAIDNISRSFYDFFGLDLGDLEKFERFLDQKIIRAIKFYNENLSLFSSCPIKKGSTEEALIVNFLGEGGKLFTKKLLPSN